MSTASRDRRPDPPAESAQEIMEAAAARALGSRRRLRLLAVAGWSSFLGAIPLLVTALAVQPADAGAPSLGQLSLAFLVTWALVMVPVSLALLLTAPHGRRILFLKAGTRASHSDGPRPGAAPHGR